MEPDKNYTIEFSHAELVFSIEALHGAIKENMRSAYINSWGAWREHVEFPLFQLVTNGTLLLYGRLLQRYQENPATEPAWVKQVQFSPKQWDLLNEIELSSDWNSLETYTETDFDDL